MPLVGLGTWQAKAGEVEAAVGAALKLGYKHIDAAAVYGNEAEVGSAIATAIEGGIIAREDLLSRPWNSEHGPDDVEAACRQTLKDLQLDYLDLYLIHWPQAFEKVPGAHYGFPRNDDNSMRYDVDTTHQETWKAMERLVDLGLSATSASPTLTALR